MQIQFFVASNFLQKGGSYFLQSGLFNIHSLDLSKLVKKLESQIWVKMTISILFFVGLVISNPIANQSSTEITPTQGQPTQEKFEWPTGLV